jgi:hypothetical protein
MLSPESKPQPALLEGAFSSPPPVSHKVLVRSAECLIGQDCPTVYETNAGEILVQGYLPTSTEQRGVNLPDGETLIRLPREFLRQIVEQLGPDFK